MGNREIEFVMRRGDILSKIFSFKVGESIFTDEPDEIYFTVKNHASEHEYLFQKTLSNSGIATIEPGKYVVTIMPEDTDNLAFSKYDFDFEIVKMPTLKRTFTGILDVRKEVTHSYNEGD